MNLYVIGAVTGKESDNLPMFNHVRGELMMKGYRVSIPHDRISSGTGWKKAMGHSIEHIGNALSWNPDSFGIAMLDDWQDSKGAKIEHDLAVSLGIPCKPWREWL